MIQDAFVYTSGSESPEIRVMGLDRATCTLTALHTIDAGPGSGYLAFSRDRRFVYGINRTPARLLAWARGPNGDLAAINSALVSGASGTTHVAVHPAGRFVLAAHFRSGHVSVHPLGADGSVGEPSDVQVTPAEAHQVVCSADGRFVFVPCRTGNVVCQFLFDEASGKLTRNEPFAVPAAPGAGPRHMAIHPSGRFAFVLDELDGTMTSYELDAARGVLLTPETVPSVPAGVTEGAAAHIEVHPSGRFVYASNRQHGSIAIWSFEASDRRLRSLGYETAGSRIKAPRDFTIDAAADLLLCANQTDGLVLVFRIGSDGALDLAGTSVAQAAPTFIGLVG